MLIVNVNLVMIEIQRCAFVPGHLETAAGIVRRIEGDDICDRGRRKIVHRYHRADNVLSRNCFVLIALWKRFVNACNCKEVTLVIGQVPEIHLGDVHTQSDGGERFERSDLLIGHIYVVMAEIRTGIGVPGDMNVEALVIRRIVTRESRNAQGKIVDTFPGAVQNSGVHISPHVRGRHRKIVHHIVLKRPALNGIYQMGGISRIRDIRYQRGHSSHIGDGGHAGIEVVSLEIPHIAFVPSDIEMTSPVEGPVPGDYILYLGKRGDILHIRLETKDYDIVHVIAPGNTRSIGCETEPEPDRLHLVPPESHHRHSQASGFSRVLLAVCVQVAVPSHEGPLIENTYLSGLAEYVPDIVEIVRGEVVDIELIIYVRPVTSHLECICYRVFEVIPGSSHVGKIELRGDQFRIEIVLILAVGSADVPGVFPGMVPVLIYGIVNDMPCVGPAHPIHMGPYSLPVLAVIGPFVCPAV